MNNDQIKAFALSLLQADSEAGVIEILKKAGYWDNSAVWRLYGDIDGNFATVGNQQARPEAALVEKIVNSVDARLLNECLVKGIDPESEKAPHSIRHAISVLFDDKALNENIETTIGEWSAQKRLAQAQEITLAVTGYKPRQGGMPCITIADRGEGQSPGQFSETFLSMHKANKLRIKFVQGKFNMGGTGVLKFCGKNSLQLIISRRNPKIIEEWKKKGSKWTSSDTRNNEWGVTVVRRERPTETTGQVRNSVFKYLAPILSDGQQNQVLSFNSDYLLAMPVENRPYEREMTHGSVIKLYEYDMKGYPSQALRSGLLQRLEALLPQAALPIRVHECRGFGGSAGSFATNLVGLSVRLGDNRGDNLEDGYPITTSFVVHQEKMTAQIYAFKGKTADSYRTNEGIIFVINGQSHGAIPKTFYERSRVKMGRLSLLVIVDCTNMSVGAREDLFMNSRDRLSNGEFRKEIEEQLESIVGGNPVLRQLRDRRRSEEIANRLGNSKPLEKILDSIIKTSPTLSRLFVFGQRLSRPHRADIDPQANGGGQGKAEGDGIFQPKQHPTYFHFHKHKYGEHLIRNAEIDRRCRIKFETDAQNDYFDRTQNPGHYELEVIDGPFEDIDLSHSLTINNGIANWNIKLPDEQIDVGDKLTLQCTVNDVTLLEPFVNVAIVTIKPYEKTDSTDYRGDPDSNSSGGESKDGGTGSLGKGGNNQVLGKNTSGGIALPDINEVHKDDIAWASHNFDDMTACKVIDDGDQGQSSYTFYINVDNIYLQTEIKDTKADVALEKTKFIWANVLIGLALIHENKQNRSRDANNETTEDVETVFSRIDRTTRALGPFLLPMIDHLGAITEEDVINLAQRGDDE